MARDVADDAEAGRSGPPVKLILLLILVVLLAVFFFQNTHDAPVHFLWMDGNWPMWSVIGISVLVGAAITKLGGFFWNRAQDRKYSDR